MQIAYVLYDQTKQILAIFWAIVQCQPQFVGSIMNTSGKTDTKCLFVCFSIVLRCIRLSLYNIHFNLISFSYGANLSLENNLSLRSNL